MSKTKFTLDEFVALVQRSDWEFTDVIEVEMEEELENGGRRIVGFGARVAELKELEIAKEETFDLCNNDKFSLKTSNPRWTAGGFIVVDQDGKELSAAALSKYFPAKYWEIDYSKLFSK